MVAKKQLSTDKISYNNVTFCMLGKFHRQTVKLAEITQGVESATS